MTIEKEWVELFPVAVTMSAGKDRPILILQDKDKLYSMPVWLGPLDAAVAMSQANPESLESSPHKSSLLIFKSLNVKITHCTFKELIGPFQYVELGFTVDGAPKTVKCRADESMSLCLLSNAKFYCPVDLIKQSREIQVNPMSAEMTSPRKLNELLN